MTSLKVDRPRTDAVNALGAWAVDVVVSKRGDGEIVATVEGEFTPVQLRMIASAIEKGDKR